MSPVLIHSTDVPALRISTFCFLDALGVLLPAVPGEDSGLMAADEDDAAEDDAAAAAAGSAGLPRLSPADGAVSVVDTGGTSTLLFLGGMATRRDRGRGNGLEQSRASRAEARGASRAACEQQRRCAE